ncbi:hypothetical protein BDQ12DRAFT_712943 [Crucibulum laeve]|uniref:Prolyl 4-hydroxylase alpha subunit domain-containing protein n=1 Tax=Crucibulum laeve TaxID=68775 RepID=A0A5C3M331_9AGAR|nr:hypothetical protein BDQ12DRAFT_712943 [Crucibulum laeve]
MPLSPGYIHAPVLDWSTTPLASDYHGCYVKILDDFFTPEECTKLISLAESEAKWEQAAVHYGLGPNQKYIDTNYRNSERILRFDKEASERLYQKLLPYVQEIVSIKPGGEWENIVGMSRGFADVEWNMVGLNERLSFLRYGPGNYFRQHCDGTLQLPDDRFSHVTVQIYLGDGRNAPSDSTESCDDSLGETGMPGGSPSNATLPLVGGPTRIWSRDGKKWLDVDAKLGRVLIFQQRQILHSGEDVKQGLKYALRTDIMFKRTLEGKAHRRE